MDRTEEILQSLDKLRKTVLEIRTEIYRLRSRAAFGDDPLISIRELAQMLDVKERQIRRYREKGWIDAAIIQRRVFFRTSSVRKLIEKHLMN